MGHQYSIGFLLLFFWLCSQGQQSPDFQWGGVVAQQASSRKKMADSYELGKELLNDSPVQSARSSEAAFKIAVRIAEDAMAARAAYQAGQAYFLQQDNTNEQLWYRKALSFAKKGKDPQMVARSAARLSEAYNRSQQFQQAFAALEEGMSYLELTGPNFSQLEAQYRNQRQALEQQIRELEARRNALLGEFAKTEGQSFAGATQEPASLYGNPAPEEKEPEGKALPADTFADIPPKTAPAEEESTSTASLSQWPVAYSNLLIGTAVVLLASLILLVWVRLRKGNRKGKPGKNRPKETDSAYSEEALLHLLPAQAARAWQENQKVSPIAYPEATVLFARITDFERKITQENQQELISELDACFKGFDFIISQYPGVEKIHTSGIAYLCASGLTEKKTLPANLIRAALEMQEFLRERKTDNLRAGKPYFECAIGVHTGPAIGGIVGAEKVTYNLWGEAVQTAERLEQKARPGKIASSEATFRLAKYQFDCDFRGKVDVRSNGLINMYYIEKEKIPNFPVKKGNTQ